MNEWKNENKNLIDQNDNILPDVYLKLKYPDDEQSQKNAIQVTIEQKHLE